MLEGHRSGRPAALSGEERERLCDILDSGPVAYSLQTGIWTSPLVRQVIEEEFGQQYHAGHVRKLLRQLGYSVQRPTTRLVQADVEQHRKWVRYTYPNLKNAKAEASFRQTPTLHATWARRGSQPQIPRAASAIHKKSLEPCVWTTPISSTFISRITFSGRPIWPSWTRWWFPPFTGAATAST